MHAGTLLAARVLGASSSGALAAPDWTMTELDGAVHENKRPLARGKNPREPVAPGRWVNPILGVLGTLVLSGYLITSLPSLAAATAPAPLSDERLTPTYSRGSGNLTHPAAAQDKSTVSSMTDLLKTALGAVLALTWAVGGVWLGRRRARSPDLFHELTPQIAFDALRAPTGERMYDETRLVPQYLRRVEFPATKHDLVRLARGHMDEGRILHKLEYIPDRRYTSLHDLMSEIRID
jgi:hypothetical protein